MLAGFRVSNFLSFKDMQNFSMIKGKSEEHPEHIINGYPKLLDRTFFYGANSAGKSNFITAVAYAQGIAIGKSKKHLCRSTDVINTLERMSYDGSDNPISYFEFLLFIKNRYFSYGFEYDCRLKTYSSEWLIELFENGSEKEIFVLDFGKNGDKKVSHNDDFDKAMHHGYDSGDSFLSISSDETSKLVYSWLCNSLYVVVASDDRWNIHHEFSINNYEIPELFTLLYKLDTGIDGIYSSDPYALCALKESETFNDLVKVSDKEIDRRMKSSDGYYDSLFVKPTVSPFKFDWRGLHIIMDREVTDRFYENRKEYCAREGLEVGDVFDVEIGLSFTHRRPHFEVDYKDESDGTKKVLEILMTYFHRVYNQDEMGYTVLYDEFECSIHILLIRQLLKILDDRRKNHRMQFIATTHESRILTLSLLRNDEVWFVDSDEKKGSSIYSLSSFSDAEGDSNIDVEYLKGRFGAIPAVREYYEEDDE